MAMTEMANISERRIFRLLAGKKGLPEFLTPQPGINSGLMIAQYSAAALTSLNRQLASPASADNIESSNGQEDHVSMGANAAWKANKIFNHLVQVISIELLAAAQAVEFRKPAKSSLELQAFFDEYRQHVAFIEKDVWMQKHISETADFIYSKL
jgi:histidine ammonia-lyase